MPDQPADPIHYDMRIPPEPHPEHDKPADSSAEEGESNSAQPKENLLRKEQDSNRGEQKK